MDKVNQLVEEMKAQKARAADAARWEGLASQGQYAANIPPVQKETSWLSSIPFVGPALDTAWQNSSVKTYWDNTVYPHVIQPINDAVTKIGQKNIAKIALTLLAATGIIVVTALPIQTNSTFGICDIPVINWFCSLISPASSPTPTIDLTAVRTQAAQTVIAQISQTVMAVTPPPPPTATVTPAVYNYTVQEGDHLSTIAYRFGIPLDELMNANGITNPDYIYKGQHLVIPVNIPPTLDGVLSDLLRNERPTEVAQQQAWGALNILSDPNNGVYPNAWWLQDGQFTTQDMLALVVNGEAGSNQLGYEAVVGRYVFYCGITPDCDGNTANLLIFLAYYQAWREPGQNSFFSNENPQSNAISSALINGDVTQLQQFGLSASLDPGNPDLPFHNANVTDDWNNILINALGRQPDGPNNFWVLSINDLKKVCGKNYGILSPNMTDINVPIPNSCQN